MMKITLKEFINKHNNWEQLLSTPPYNLLIKHDGDYALFKYNQFESDMSLSICQEARGIIFHKPTNTPVCVPFFKFFNYGEEYAAEIDWSNVHVNEKIDGSLMKVWYHNGWHLSTNGTIDAYKALVGDKDLTFGKLFELALTIPINEFYAQLDKNYTYMFELVHPEMLQVINYEKPFITYLGKRNMTTYEEEPVFGTALPGTKPMYDYSINEFSDINKIVDLVENMDDSHEGIVVCDNNFNRIKVKSPLYLLMAHAHNNGVITDKRILSMYRADVLDDFLQYAPNQKDKVNEVMNICNDYVQHQEELYRQVRKKTIEFIKELGGDISYIMSRMSNKTEMPMDYFRQYVTLPSAVNIIQKERDKN